MAKADANTPIRKPTCCRHGVAPTMKPVLRSCDVAPALAAAVETMAPTTRAAVWYAIPDQPTDTNSMHVPMIVAMVIPLIGLLVVPIIPTMRDDTVTKKKPKMMIRTESRRLLGKCVGRPFMKEMPSARTAEPIRTTLIGMSLSVRRAAPAPAPLDRLLTLSRNEDQI